MFARSGLTRPHAEGAATLFPGRDTDDLTDEAIMREVLDTVGKLLGGTWLWSTAAGMSETADTGTAPVRSILLA